jgi:hypothetical protein
MNERSCVEKMGEVASTMCLGMDGTGVPMRAAEVAGRTGKQPDGSAKTREATVVTVWTAESRGRLQSGDRYPASAGWHALDRAWRKRHHRPALLQAQRTLRGLL